MYKIHCLNNISPEGLALLTDEYELTDNVEEADAILVRSADMHAMDIPAKCKAASAAWATLAPMAPRPMTPRVLPMISPPANCFLAFSADLPTFSSSALARTVC